MLDGLEVHSNTVIPEYTVMYYSVYTVYVIFRNVYMLGKRLNYATSFINMSRPETYLELAGYSGGTLNYTLSEHVC